MPASLPLSEMTIAEKLRAMEELRDDLCRSDEPLPSPAWHGDVLAERENLVAEGAATFSDWEEARQRVAQRCHDHPDSRPR